MLKDVIDEQKRNEAEAAEVESRRGPKVFGREGEISVNQFPAEALPQLLDQFQGGLDDRQAQVDAIKVRMRELGVEIPGETNAWKNLSESDLNDGTLHALRRVYQNSLNPDGSTPPEAVKLLQVIESMERAKLSRATK